MLNRNLIGTVVLAAAGLSFASAWAQEPGGDGDSSGESTAVDPSDGPGELADSDGELLRIADEPVDAVAAEVVTLERVLALASEMSPMVAVGDAELRAATYRRLEARWQRFPRIRLNASISPAPRVELERDPETGELDPFSNRESDAELLESILGGAGLSFRHELTAVVPITSFGKIRLATQLAQAGIDVAETQRDVALRESQFEALRAYLTVQWYREVDRILREASRRLDDAEEELEWRLDDGDRAARTSLRDLTIARTDFVELRADADGLGLLARHALAASLGLPTEFRAEPLDETLPTDAVPALDSVLEFAAGNRPDYVLLDQAARAADLNRLLRWRSFAPDLFVAGRLNQAWTPTVDDVSGPFINDPYNRFGFGFLVGLRWNINPAVSTARARRAEAEAAVAEAQMEAAWLGIEIEVTEAWFEASGRRDVLLSYSDAVRAADAALNQIQFQYDQGLADYDELKDPLETYYRTSAGYYEAVLRYRLAVADLALKSGQRDLWRWPGASETD